jgi:hypothetical protein
VFTRRIKFSVQCTVTLMSMTGNLSPLTTQSEISLVNQTPDPERAGAAGRLSARKRTNTTVGEQSIARVTRGWHMQGQKEE